MNLGIVKWSGVTSVVILFVGIVAGLLIPVWGSRIGEADSVGPPHIVFIMLDSVGKGDLFAPDDKMGYSTPGVNKLSNVGAVIKFFYVQPQSSPSRASLLTGKYPYKMGLQEQLVSGTTAHIPLSVPTLPELLQAAANFETHLVGGWGLGGASIQYTPTARGFDTFYGFLGDEINYVNLTRGRGFDFWDETAAGLITGYRHPAWSAKGNYSTRLYRNRTVEILEKYAASHPSSDSQSTNPLFLMIAHQGLHGPLSGHPDLSGSRCKKASKARKVYCAIMMEIDDAIAETHAQLIRLGLWDRTLLVLVSDSASMVPLRGVDENGLPISPGSFGSNYPFRGSKSTLFDGGVRGVALVSGGRLDSQARGKAYEGLAHAVDVPVFLLSSVLQSSRLTVISKRSLLNAIRDMDGSAWLDLLPSTERVQLQGLKATRTEVPINIVSSGQDYTAIRFGRWKFIVGATQEYRTGDGWWPPSAEGPPQLPKPERHRLLFVYRLYDLFTDPYERNNMANLTEIVKEARNRIKSLVNAGDYYEPQFNAFNPLSLPMLHGGAWAPFLDRPKSGLPKKDYDPFVIVA